MPATLRRRSATPAAASAASAKLPGSGTGVNVRNKSFGLLLVPSKFEKPKLPPFSGLPELTKFVKSNEMAPLLSTEGVNAPLVLVANSQVYELFGSQLVSKPLALA